MIEPITAGLVAGFVSEKVRDKVVDLGVEALQKFGISRWSAHRAERFLTQLMEELRKQQDIKHDSATLDELLGKVATGDKETSLLFDAYRRVALCASKDIGPMVIAVRTASLLAKHAEASDDDEQIFMAAESLNDRDFIEFIRWIDGRVEEVRTPKHKNLQPPVVPGLDFITRVTARATRGTFDNDGVPINLFTDVGAFAPKLQTLGILVSFTRPTPVPSTPQRVEHFVGATSVAKPLYAVTKRVSSIRPSES
ncbi:hypothetical protein [Paraburkholderia hayleyella]|uniref:hypothetical protein n=1 Tax=Paraburkholderia hayleyella TaxID=2152889 RepID=UPI001291DC59|nr:hypothetical protein [Paraburkholderia hayleyella]